MILARRSSPLRVRELTAGVRPGFIVCCDDGHAAQSQSQVSRSPRHSTLGALYGSRPEQLRSEWRGLPGRAHAPLVARWGGSGVGGSRVIRASDPARARSPRPDDHSFGVSMSSSSVRGGGGARTRALPLSRSSSPGRRIWHLQPRSCDRDGGPPVLDVRRSLYAETDRR